MTSIRAMMFRWLQCQKSGAARKERHVMRALSDLELGPDDLGRLAQHESLGLSQKVGEENVVVQPLCDRVVRRDGRNKIGGDKLCALVDELVKRMLPIGPGLTPHNRPCGPTDGRTIASDSL